MYFENHNFPTVGSLLKALEPNALKPVRFEVDGEFLHPVRFGTYADPMATPTQFIFVAKDSKDTPFIPVHELVEMIQYKLHTNIAEETGGIDGLVHEMVHVMGMVSTPEKEAHMPLSLLNMRVDGQCVTIEATSEWWITFEAYYAYRNTEAGAARINVARLSDFDLTDFCPNDGDPKPDLEKLYSDEYHPLGFRYLHTEARVRLGVKNPNWTIGDIWVRLIGCEQRGRDLAYIGLLESPFTDGEVKFRASNVLEIHNQYIDTPFL
ncbi:hypothetical protein [Sulfitobacter sp. R18_1]|uniref:hypothetical protein n=1 Tax=Sulfitobacter sp. R18_1 TaxID=2821104 RepID=UPI001AD95DF6|nr:hypothetical protein [Sulfitobacter sp. R18_1]MBO9428775.1 hypothetical protein [Sulfitobacter sp. R18_1]